MSPVRVLLVWAVLLSGCACNDTGSAELFAPEGEAIADTLIADRPRADLADIRGSGVLRILTMQREIAGVPRPGADHSSPEQQLEDLADRLGVRLVRVVAPSRAALGTMLVAGKGDLIGELAPIEA